MSFSKLRELVMHREAQHSVVHGVTRSRTRLSDWTELMKNKYICPECALLEYTNQKSPANVLLLLHWLKKRRKGSPWWRCEFMKVHFCSQPLLQLLLLSDWIDGCILATFLYYLNYYKIKTIKCTVTLVINEWRTGPDHNTHSSLLWYSAFHSILPKLWLWLVMLFMGRKIKFF